MRPEQVDAYRTTLETRVRAVEHDADGAVLTLEKSLFYPTSGGQPHDTGVIAFSGGTATVVDVTAAGPDAVRHRVEGPVPAEGQEVELRLDWPRRYRHMQRHSAQHLLSQAFVRESFAYETRSVSLASPDATLDLAGAPDEAQVAAAFARARDWAYASLAIHAFEVEENELARWPLRRPPKVTGRIRLVRMGEVEVAACGGTHLARTAEALPLLWLGTKRVRGGLTRVTFRAGLEASERAEATLTTLDGLAQGFSCRWDEVPARVDRLRSELRAAADAAVTAQRKWADAIVQPAARAAGAPDDEPFRFVIDDPEDLQVLAEACAERMPGTVALLAAREAHRVTLLFQAGPASHRDVRPALQAALEQVNGRGGGRADRAQGAGPEPEATWAALEAAEAALRRVEDDRA